jgi:isopenicillin N synthase-like dioxygenase
MFLRNNFADIHPQPQESYEIGSDLDDIQPNIWLPESVLPGFKGYFSGLYERLAGVCTLLLEVLSAGLTLDEEEHKALMDLILVTGCQLRLLHYPPITREKLRDEMLARLPAHNDWG